MKKPSVDLIIKLHEMLIEKSGGSKGIRDLGLLESSINSPFQTFGGAELYPDDLDKIINISYSLVKNHSFIDGNKRIVVLVLTVLLKENSYKVDWKDEYLIKLGIELASGEMTKEDFKTFTENKIINDWQP